MFVVEGDHETLAGKLNELAHQGLPRTAVDAAGADRCGFRVHRVGVFRVDTGFKNEPGLRCAGQGQAILAAQAGKNGGGAEVRAGLMAAAIAVAIGEGKFRPGPDVGGKAKAGTQTESLLKRDVGVNGNGGVFARP